MVYFGLFSGFKKNREIYIFLVSKKGLKINLTWRLTGLFWAVSDIVKSRGFPTRAYTPTLQFQTSLNTKLCWSRRRNNRHRATKPARWKFQMRKLRVGICEKERAFSVQNRQSCLWVAIFWLLFEGWFFWQRRSCFLMEGEWKGSVRIKFKVKIFGGSLIVIYCGIRQVSYFFISALILINGLFMISWFRIWSQNSKIK